MPLVSDNLDLVRMEQICGYNVLYTDRTNGAGLLIYKDFVKIVSKILNGTISKNCLEWCAGPGFIGYALLLNNLCTKLTLLDIYEPALKLANDTARINKLNNVETILSNNFQSVNREHKYDLIVSNPPHFSGINYWNEQWTYEKRIYIDENWKIHTDFFNNVANYLTNDGYVILVENAWGSGVETFKDCIEYNGLEIVDHFFSDLKSAELGKVLYYLIIRKKYK